MASKKNPLHSIYLVFLLIGILMGRRIVIDIIHGVFGERS